MDCADFWVSAPWYNILAIVSLRLAWSMVLKKSNLNADIRKFRLHVIAFFLRGTKQAGK